MVEGQSYDDLAKAGADLATAAQQIGADRWPRFINDAERRASSAVSNNAVPGVIKASDTGTDMPVAGALLLGGLLIYFSMNNGRQEPNPTTPIPSLPSVVETKPPQDAKDASGAKAPRKPGAAEGFQDPKGGESWVPNPNGRGYGWQDAKGDVWVPSGPGRNEHGGSHWNVESSNGEYSNIYPGGRKRLGR